MDNLLSGIYLSLKNGEEVVVATIVTVSGSTPRTSGSRMVVYQDGQTNGTIGGGGVEADVVRKALLHFSSKDIAIASYDLNNPSATDQLDLICGGKMEVLIEFVAGNKDNVGMFFMLNESMQNFKPLLWVGRLFSSQKPYRIKRALQLGEGQWVGPFPVAPELEAGSHHLQVWLKNHVCLHE